MKGKDVVKALEYCINHDECGMGCPCFSEKLEMCGDYSGLLRQCLEFIKRLKAERSKYKNKAQKQKGELARLNKQVAEQKEEIEMYRLDLADVTVKLFAMCKKIDEMHAKLKIVTEQCLKERDGESEIQKKTCCG